MYLLKPYPTCRPLPADDAPAGTVPDIDAHCQDELTNSRCSISLRSSDAAWSNCSPAVIIVGMAVPVTCADTVGPTSALSIERGIAVAAAIAPRPATSLAGCDITVLVVVPALDTVFTVPLSSTMNDSAFPACWIAASVFAAAVSVACFSSSGLPELQPAATPSAAANPALHSPFFVIMRTLPVQKPDFEAPARTPPAGDRPSNRRARPGPGTNAMPAVS